MADVQSRATSATSVAEKPLLAKIKDWFGATKQPEAAN
jgi:hypothetical protein